MSREPERELALNEGLDIRTGEPKRLEFRIDPTPNRMLTLPASLGPPDYAWREGARYVIVKRSETHFELVEEPPE